MLLQAEKICKSYGTNAILTDIVLQINERERVGLVGANGAGKSTLLQILAGHLSYDSGRIHRSKELTIGYVEQNSGLQSELTIWNEMMSVFDQLLSIEQELRALEAQMGDPAVYNDEERFEQTTARYDRLAETFRQHDGYEIETKVRSVLHGMGFGTTPFDTPIDHLSGGQQTRLALAKLLLSEPDLLLLDEPTNHLDLDTLGWLEDYLKAYPGAILVVSHDRYFLDALVHTVYEIERTKATRYTGNYTRFMELKAAEYEINVKHFEKQQDEIAKMEQFVQRNIARASTSNRAKSRRKALERMDRLESPSAPLKKASFRFEIERMSGKDVLHAEALSFAFSAEKNSLFSNLHLQLSRGESVALIGPNGSGKTSLLKTLTGEYTPTSGTVKWGANVKVAYYDQQQQNLNPDNTILDELWDAYPHLEEVKIRSVLGNFLFSGEDVLKKIASLSGGEKARVSLAKLMLQNANVLLLDEPTNHLDLYSKEVLESALIDYEGTILFISHDRYFLNKMAEKIWEMSSDGIHHFLGNFDDYVEKKKEIAEIKAEQLEKANAAHKQKQHSPKNKPLDYEEMKKREAEERKRKRRVEQLELEIEQLETEIHHLESLLSLPEISQSYEKLQEISEEIQQKKHQLESLFTEWESLV